MSSNTVFKIVVLAAFFAHGAAIGAVWYFPRGANGLLLLNGLLALITLGYAGSRAHYILVARDWAYVALIVFELAVLTAAILAFRGSRPALLCSYAAFGLHACGTLAGVFVAFVFRITRLI